MNYNKMNKADANVFYGKWDDLKKQFKHFKSNIFLNPSELNKVFQKKECKMYIGESNLYILIPRHNYYDLLYVMFDNAQFIDDFNKIKKTLSNDLNIRVSIIDKEPASGEMRDLFEKAGFKLNKKILRMKTVLIKPGKEVNVKGVGKMRSPSVSLGKAISMFYEDNKHLLALAQPGDENEILEMLKEDFDLIGDNLPDLEEIRERILAEEVAVARLDGQIISVNYFEIRSSAHYVYYTVTREKYRGAGGYTLALIRFVEMHLANKGIKPTRVYGWRDATADKLIKSSRASNEVPDGVVIYNLSCNMIKDDSPVA